LQTLEAAAANAIAHLAGGRVGECDRHQLFEVAGVFERWVDVGEEPLGQHEGFAAAGAGGERDAAVTRFEREALLLGEGAFGGGGNGGHAKVPLPFGERLGEGRADLCYEPGGRRRR
jgi:hypothetical protein